MTDKAIQLFTFQAKDLRVIVDDKGDPWFVAKDVCELLGIDNPSQAISRLDDDEKSTIILNEGAVNPYVSIISESGAYSLILGSRKPEAKPIKRFVTHEVMPAIRQTGMYAPNLTHIEITAKQAQHMVEIERQQIAMAKEQQQMKLEQAKDRQVVNNIVEHLSKEPVNAILAGHLLSAINTFGEKIHSKTGYGTAHNLFKNKFGIDRYNKLPTCRYTEAMNWLREQIDRQRPFTPRMIR